jgi:hypothetical protein
VLGFVNPQREPRRFEQQREREQVNHVLVDLKQKVLGQNDEEHHGGPSPTSLDVRAQELPRDARRPDEREQIDDGAEAVAERVPEETRHRVGRGVVRRGRREEVARHEERAAQTALGVEQAVVEHVPGDVREGEPQQVEEEERRQYQKPELSPRALGGEGFRDDVEVPGDTREQD